MIQLVLATAMLLTACGTDVSAPAPPEGSSAPVQDESGASASPAPAPSPVDVSSSPAPPAGSSPGTGSPGPLQPSFTITTADDGKTFHAKVGQVIDLALQANQGMENWTVQDPDPAILAPTVNPAATAVRGATLRAYTAVAPGTATIAATDKAVCPPGQACPLFVVAWKATVVVDPS